MKKTQTYLAIAEEVRRMAGMAAARTGKRLSEYVADLIRKDATETGIATLLASGETSETGGAR